MAHWVGEQSQGDCWLLHASRQETVRLEPAAPVNTRKSGSGAADGGFRGLCPTKPRHLVTGKGVSLYGQGQSAHTDWSLRPQHLPHPALSATRAGPWPRAFVDHQPCGLSLWGGAQQPATCSCCPPTSSPTHSPLGLVNTLLPPSSPSQLGCPLLGGGRDLSFSDRGSGPGLRAGLRGQADLGFRSLG